MAIRLVWSPPQSAAAPLPMEWIDAIAALGPARIEQALLPPLGTTPESVLRLADGKLGAGPPPPEPLSPQAQGALVKAVGQVGDLAYLHRRAGKLVVASGKVARLGTGPVAALAGRDLAAAELERSVQLSERGLISSAACSSGGAATRRTGSSSPGTASTGPWRRRS